MVLQIFLVNILFAMPAVHAQKLDEIKINIQANNVPLKDVIQIIERKSDLIFSYNSREIPLEKKVSLCMNETYLNKVLEQLAVDAGLSFYQVNNLIIIKKAGSSKEKEEAVPEGKNNVIKGVVIDSLTHEALVGANVFVIGTSLGCATNIEGEFRITNVTDGTYQIRISYVGYTTKDLTVRVMNNETINLNLKLSAKNIEGKAVVVTAQASGQKQAINKQLTSDQIQNVVSAAKIQELPDANAAESVGRLPGVSITRSGGEGTEVVIRGLEPKYNSVTIDGIKMSSTNGDNRSTDLSMISSNMLDGIEVSKTVTADMDADVLGGTVNFDLHEANVKTPGVPQYNFQAQGGYNNLSDIYCRYNNYKYIGSFENRFFDSRLGIFAQVAIERKNLTSNEMGASYDHMGSISTTAYKTTGLALDYIYRDKQRYNGALVLDYKLPDGKIKLTNFFSTDNTNYQYRQEYYDISNNYHYNNFSGSNSKLSIITNGLSYEQQLPIFQMDAQIAHSYSETKSPDNWAVSFLQTSAGLSSFLNVDKVNPQSIPSVASINLDKTFLNGLTTGSSYSKEQQITGSLDFKTDLNLSDLVNAEVKFGGKYRYQKRSYTTDSYDNGGGALTLGGQATVDNLIKSQFGIPSDYATQLPVTYFLDSDFNYGKFLNGDYVMRNPLSYTRMMQMVNLVKSNYSYIIAQNAASNYGRNNFSSTTNNYDGHENLSAAYLMSTIKIGQQITVIPGIRYQDLQTVYTGVRGVENKQSYLVYNHYDTTVAQDHGYWLPDVSVKYKPLSWLDIRFSYTNTVAYPDYSAIIPRIDVSSGSSAVIIDYNNYQLKPSRSQNYDVYVSVYDNTIGLFTVGGFLKQIKDFIYGNEFHISGAEAAQYLPLSLVSGSSSKTYTVYTNYNNSYQINDYGMELDWQTHFWYLPGPLSGMVFNVNYTHIFSKAQYPYTYTTTKVGRNPVYTDTSYTGRLFYQPDDIINMSLGFDYKNFSARISLLYQSDIFTGTNFWPQLRSHTTAYRRWDFSIKQGLPWYGIEVFGDINNINGEDDVSVIQGGGVPISEQDYGMTADLGFRIKL
jgi:TonB-dependent receptor